VAFFATCFSDPAEASLAADLITYFGRSGALLEAMALNPEGTHTCLATFQHDPLTLLEHLESGITELDLLVGLLPERPCQALLQVEGGDVFLQIFGR
jgi:hypothetical protein